MPKRSTRGNKQKKKREINPEYYFIVDRELRSEFERETGKNSYDQSYKLFTNEEQIERYSFMMCFWDKHRPDVDMDNCGEYEAAKLYYVALMRVKTVQKIQTFPDELQKGIIERYEELKNNN